MEPALKQRLLGAAVLVALAVTFLPLLVMDPAPESGASTVPLRAPAAPDADDGTIVMPIGPDAPAPATAVTESPDRDTAPATTAGMMPAATAGGDYAVTFGRYATPADAAKVVAALRASQLPAYQEPSPSGDRTLHRVLVGPFPSHAVAEGARLRAAHVNDQVAARVITLDVVASTAGTATPSKPGAPASLPAATTTVATRPSAAVAAQPLEPPKPAAAPPTATPPAAAAAPAAPAASGVGFAVQLGAFANADEAARLRDRARGAGFSAFVERVQTGSGVLNRVRIGPVTERAEADRQRARAAGALGVDGLVRPHP